MGTAAIFIMLAAICNALMDRIENENFFKSVFSKLNQKFWYKRESWRWGKMIFAYRVDAWHLAKSLMIIFMVLAITKDWKEVLIYGAVWNLTFNLFYNKIFKN